MEVKYRAEDWPMFERDFARADAEMENCARCEGRVDICPNSTRGFMTVIRDGWPKGWPEVAVRPCEEMKKHLAGQRMEARMSAAGISAKFWSRTFDRFVVDDSNREAYKTARKYASSFRQSRRWLLLNGPAGRGKTHLGVAVLLEAMKQDVQPLFLRAKDAIYQLHESYQKGSTEEYRDQIEHAELLMLDDVGEENDAKDKEFITAIIKSRYEAELPTILTSNLDAKGLLGKYGDAVFSRLEEVCDVVKMTGGDYRVKMASGGAK